MKLKIVFKASLKRYSNSSDGIDNISIDGPATIQDIIDLYGISPLDVGITIINGKMVPRSHVGATEPDPGGVLSTVSRISRGKLGVTNLQG